MSGGLKTGNNRCLGFAQSVVVVWKVRRKSAAGDGAGGVTRKTGAKTQNAARKRAG